MDDARLLRASAWVLGILACALTAACTTRAAGPLGQNLRCAGDVGCVGQRLDPALDALLTGELGGMIGTKCDLAGPIRSESTAHDLVPPFRSVAVGCRSKYLALTYANRDAITTIYTAEGVITRIDRYSANTPQF